MASNSSFDQAIRTAARRTAVRVTTASTVGSGFFARAGIVLTCAHVVGTAREAVVEWEDNEYRCRVLSCHPAEPADDDGNWPYPDIAVLRLENAPSHPIPFFSPAPPSEGEHLLAYGFAEGEVQTGPQHDGVLVTTTAASGDYQRVKDDQIVAQMSGSMVISTRTGLVVGMIKASRDIDGPRGGWLTPSHILAEILADAVPPAGDDSGFDVGGWTDALLTPLRSILRAQVEATAELPYRLLEPPVPSLSDVYVEQQAAEERGPIDIAKMLAEHRHALIIGSPGSGKSSLVQQICSATARWWLERTGPAPFGPVIALRAAASSLLLDRPFLDSLTASVERDLGPLIDAPPPPEIFGRALIPGVSWLILIDGLDEVIDPEQQKAILRAIDQRMQDLDQPQRLVVTSRPLHSAAMATKSAVARFELMPFDRSQLECFAHKWFTVRREVVGAADDAEAEAIAKRFVAQVEATHLESLAGVPLLLTIAAIVFERSPDAGLPPTITTLYEQFVELVFSRTQTHAPDSGAAANFAQIWDDRVALMEATAYRWFFDSGRPIFDVALELVLRKQTYRYTDKAALRSYLRALIVETGVVVVVADELQWIHVSVAEYLASRVLARKFSLDQWLWLCDRTETANIARLALVHVARTRGLSADFVERLVDRPSAGLSLRELLGTTGLLSDEVVAQLARRAERRGKLEIAPFAAHPAAAAVLRQSATSAFHLGRRIDSASALISDGAPADARAGIQALASLAAKEWFAESRLDALSRLITAARKRADPAEFAEDIRNAQRSAAEVINRWWRRQGYRVELATAWPSALAEDDLLRLLTTACRSARTSAGTAIDAANHLAQQFNEPMGVEVLEAVGKRQTRFRLGRSSTDEDADAPPARSRDLVMFMGVVLFGGSIVIVGTELMPPDLRMVGVLLMLVALMTVGLPFLLDDDPPFAPWWPRPTRAAERARAALYDLANNGEAGVQQLAIDAIRRNGWREEGDGDLSLLDWIRRKHIGRRAEALAAGTIRSDGTDPGEAIAELRQLMTTAGRLGRRVVSRAIFRTAYDNPRSARPLLLLLVEQARVKGRLRERAKQLLEVLDADDF